MRASGSACAHAPRRQYIAIGLRLHGITRLLQDGLPEMLKPERGRSRSTTSRSTCCATARAARSKHHTADTLAEVVAGDRGSALLTRGPRPPAPPARGSCCWREALPKPRADHRPSPGGGTVRWLPCGCRRRHSGEGGVDQFQMHGLPSPRGGSDGSWSGRARSKSGRPWPPYRRGRRRRGRTPAYCSLRP